MNALLQEFTSVNIASRTSVVFPDISSTELTVTNNRTIVGTQEIKLTKLINKIVLIPLKSTLRCPMSFPSTPRGTAPMAAMARACRVAMPMDIKFNDMPMYIGTTEKEYSVQIVATSEEVNFKSTIVPLMHLALLLNL